MQGKLWVRVLCAAALLGGCGDDAPADAGGAADAAVDAGGGAGAPGASGHAFGESCSSSADCDSRLFCDTEVDTSYDAENLPPDSEQVARSAFPGGVCTPLPAAPYDATGSGDSCDPFVPLAAQGCGDDGTCVPVVIDVQGTTAFACRPRCDPAAANPCRRSGYSCDFTLKACVEGCQSDDECRLLVLDTNSDGQADTLRYDDQSRATCDTTTFECVHSGNDSGKTGIPCKRLDDCDSDGLCVQAQQLFGDAQFPGGYCTKLGCDVAGRECEDGAVCAPLRELSPGAATTAACFTGCEVGAEPESDQLGATGHGKGCRSGYRCQYNGGSRSGQGVCVGGNYNEVKKDNVGAACETDAECHSRFGFGHCLRLRVDGVPAPTGMCTVMDCAVPELADGACGSGNQCVGLGGDVTFCLQSCDEAGQCAESFACTDDDGDPTTSKVCYPVCLEDADCRKGDERCQISPDATDGAVGTCVASRP
jgi:hypothetical protein